MASVLELVDQGIALVQVAERDDLLRRLGHTRRRLLDTSVRVIVVGEFKQGKSKLVNALVTAPICPVDDDIATSVPTVVSYGSPPSAVLVRAKGTDQADEDTGVERLPIALDDLAAQVSEKGNPGNRRGLIAAEVKLPRNLLNGGLSIIDTPGVGGLDSAHALATLTALPTADAVLLVSDASQEYTEPEMRFLGQAMRICPNVACVLTKTDLYPQWRQVAELNEGHLAAHAPGTPLIPVSSDLRMHAARLKDKELNVESGFGELVTYLRSNIVGESERLQRASVAQDLYSVTDQLRLALNAELGTLEDPEGTPGRILDLEAAKERADVQRRRSARWQVTLNDGMTDLIADMEHDLRDRLRQIQREAEEAIDSGDPGPVWDQFIYWMQQRVASAVSDTFVWTNERTQWLSEHVAHLFAEDEESIPVLQVDNTDGVLDPVHEAPALDPGYLGPMEKVLIGMRGSYGGVLMFGLLTGIVGMSLINPLSLGAGVLLGAKAYKEDKAARLKRRQAEAKLIVRKQIEDVIFQVGKQLKDRLRVVQRGTRDHFTDLADQHHRSIAESLAVAQKSAATYASDRVIRTKEIKALLKRVDSLAASARALAPALEPAQPEGS